MSEDSELVLKPDEHDADQEDYGADMSDSSDNDDADRASLFNEMEQIGRLSFSHLTSFTSRQQLFETSYSLIQRYLHGGEPRGVIAAVEYRKLLLLLSRWSCDQELEEDPRKGRKINNRRDHEKGKVTYGRH